MPIWQAYRVASVRFATPSFLNTLARWNFTVCAGDREPLADLGVREAGRGGAEDVDLARGQRAGAAARHGGELDHQHSFAGDADREAAPVGSQVDDRGYPRDPTPGRGARHRAGGPAEPGEDWRSRCPGACGQGRRSGTFADRSGRSGSQHAARPPWDRRGSDPRDGGSRHEGTTGSGRLQEIVSRKLRIHLSAARTRRSARRPATPDNGAGGRRHRRFPRSSRGCRRPPSAPTLRGPR